MIESALAGVLALIVALATVPGVVFFVGWSALLIYLTWRWSVRKAQNHPEWFARRNAQAAKIDAGAQAIWARIAEQFDKPKA